MLMRQCPSVLPMNLVISGRPKLGRSVLLLLVSDARETPTSVNVFELRSELCVPHVLASYGSGLVSEGVLAVCWSGLVK